jgi:uncharacterized protein (TIGR03437 family)
MLAMRLALAAAVLGLGPATAGTEPGAPSIGVDSLVNAATGESGLAPYSIATLYGANLFLDGAANAFGGLEVPETFAGVTVLIGPTPAGLFYLSANQINLLIPNSLGPGNYSVTVVRDGVASQSQPITIQPVAPGLFAATHADGTAVTEDAPAVRGEVVIFYATGLGPAQPNPPDRFAAPSTAPIAELADFQVLLDGTAIDSSLVQYAGLAPLNAGLYQVNVLMPANLPPTNPEIRLSVAGSLSPPGWNLITASLPPP